MAEAVRSLFPGVKITIGPAIETGFYYDFDPPQPFTPEDLERIETRMQELVRQDLPFSRREVSWQEAVDFFRGQGETYKLELLQDLQDQQVSLYKQGDFVDLCRGPHIPSAGYLRAFKLTGVAGAYWRGDERNPMLQRIYGTAFATAEELEEHLHFLEEAKRRDHRRLGRELGLFAIRTKSAPDWSFTIPKGPGSGSCWRISRGGNICAGVIRSSWSPPSLSSISGNNPVISKIIGRTCISPKSMGSIRYKAHELCVPHAHL